MPALSTGLLAAKGHMRRPFRVCSAATAVFLLVSPLCDVASAAEPKRVMLLHSFGRDFKPWSEYARTIREELERQTKWPLDLIDQSLVTARLSGNDPEGPFAEYLGKLHA